MIRPTPVACPKCLSTERVEEADQSGSSGRWFDCGSCGHRWTEAPKSAPSRRIS